MRDKFLPFALPDVDDQELLRIKEALDSGWVTTGPKTKQFEAEFAAAVSAQHAIAINSCTAAMHLALEAIGLRRGDEVIVPTYTFAASAEVARHKGIILALISPACRLIWTPSLSMTNTESQSVRLLSPLASEYNG